MKRVLKKYLKPKVITELIFNIHKTVLKGYRIQQTSCRIYQVCKCSKTAHLKIDVKI